MVLQTIDSLSLKLPEMPTTKPNKLQYLKTTARQFIMFAGVGAIGTVGHYLVLILMVQVGGAAPLTGSTCGFLVGAFINYLLNYRFTFESKKEHKEALAKFMVVAALGFGLNAAIMFLGTEVLRLHYFGVQLVATGIVLVSNFAFNKAWTFAVRENN